MYLFRNMHHLSQETLAALFSELHEKANGYGLFDLGDELVLAATCNGQTMQDIIARYSLDAPLTSNIQRKMKKKKAKQTAS